MTTTFAPPLAVVPDAAELPEVPAGFRAGYTRPDTATMDWGYIRVSSLDQHPEVQVYYLIQRGIDPAHMFIDHGVSGKRKSRPAWDQLEALTARGDAVHVVRLDRIGRSVANLAAIAADFEERGVHIVAHESGIDTRKNSGSALGKLFYGMLALIGEFELNLIIERTADGQAAVRHARNLRRSTGGPPPLGWQEGEGDDWEREPVSAAIMLTIAERMIDGGERNVSKLLREEGPLFTSETEGRPSAPVNLTMLVSALVRPTAAGLIVTARDEHGNPLVYTPSKVAGAAPLDRDTWEALVGIFDERKRGAPPAEDGEGQERYPLGKALFCGVCGNQLSGEKNYSTGRDAYRCANAHVRPDGSKPKPCRKIQIDAAQLHDAIAEQVEDWKRDNPWLAAAHAQESAVSERVAWLRAELERVQARQSNLEEKFDAGRLTEAQYNARDARLGERFAEVADELAELGADGGKRVPDSLDWPTMTGAEQRELLAMAFEPVEVMPAIGTGRRLSALERVTLVPLNIGEQVAA